VGIGIVLIDEDQTTAIGLSAIEHAAAPDRSIENRLLFLERSALTQF